MSRHEPSISMYNAQNDVQRHAKLYECCAYRSLDEDGRRSPPLLSVSMKLPSRNELAAKRPSSAQVFPHSGSDPAKEMRGLCNRKSLSRDRGRQSESPNEWFQRIMRVRKLSPLDLCEKFSHGDARRNLLVSLDHVCQVLFDLDPESGNDPVTEAMEDLLYQYASEQNGEIMVNIREALRSLDIWQTRSSTSTTHINTQSSATNLILGNRKLQNVVSSLQGTNLQLSKELNSAKSAICPIFGEEMTFDGNLPQNQANRNLAKDASLPIKDKSTVTIEPGTTPPRYGTLLPKGLQIVNDHEQELIEVASKLQFTGVERLEHLLVKGDADSTGFVNIQHLCRLLADQFELKVSEVRLVEMCLGMKFDSKAQLDYKEFVNVLMDILIYALPSIRDSGKKKSLYRLDKYLESGFLPGRETARQVLDALCSKYDLSGNQCLPAADLVRIFQEDLVKHHASKLPFPLKKHEIIQLAQPFIRHRTDDSSSDGVFAYPELLNATLGPLSIPVSTNTKHLNRALKWGFWREIYMALCSGNVRMEKKVRTQLEKIMMKLDPGVSFTISMEHFRRIFDQHLGPKDMEVLNIALAVPKVDACGSSLRYDVLLNLVFGSELNDEIFLESILEKLSHIQKRIESFVDKTINVRGLSHKLSLQDFHDVFMIPVEKNSLTLIETLFLFASAASSWNGQIDVKALTILLKSKCWSRNFYRGKDERSIAQAARSNDASDTEKVKKIIAECCYKYNLHQRLHKVGGKTQGWIFQNDMAKELGKMLRQLGVIGVGQKDLHNFVSNIARHSARFSQNATTFCLRNVIHCDAIFDALFDWDSMVSRMRLTHLLVEVKKVFEKFDRERDGTIRSEDWNTIFRSISSQNQDFHKWEVRVLERKFPGQFHKHTIDYARLVVFLLDYEQRQARKVLQGRILDHFQQLLHRDKSGADIEKLFRAIDVDHKGYFDAADLKTYMTRVFAREGEYEPQGDSSVALWNSTDAAASIMRLFAKLDLKDIRDCSSTDNCDSQNAVTLQSFRNIARSLRANNHQYIAFGPHNKNDTTQMDFEPYENADSPMREYRTVSSLRSLEMAILNITSMFVDQEGNFRPAHAFRYLTLTATHFAHTSRHTPPTSPLRRSTLSSVSSRAARKNPQDQDVLTLASLTPSSIKKLLFDCHKIKTSKHLVSQFFLHIGSPSKHFLDLLHFAKWTVPLPCKLYEKVQHLIKQMLVKGKGGGGRMGMEQFLAQLQRQLQHSPHYEGTENTPVQYVPMSLLLSKLRQLDISLHKQELFLLLRHFGMDDDLERVDYASLLHHMGKLENIESYFA